MSGDKCQCDGPCLCSLFIGGPPAYRVQRAGRSLHVCTRCLQAGDEKIEPVVTLAEVAELSTYDPLGARLLSRTLRRRNATTLN
jgi:hypothetical protein